MDGLEPIGRGKGTIGELGGSGTMARDGKARWSSWILVYGPRGKQAKGTGRKWKGGKTHQGGLPWCGANEDGAALGEADGLTAALGFHGGTA